MKILLLHSFLLDLDQNYFIILNKYKVYKYKYKKRKNIILYGNYFS